MNIVEAINAAERLAPTGSIVWATGPSLNVEILSPYHADGVMGQVHFYDVGGLSEDDLLNTLADLDGYLRSDAQQRGGEEDAGL